MLRLKEIKRAAAKNAAERLELIKMLLGRMDRDEHLRKRIDNIDDSFIRKMYRFPGDITTHRIATVLEKIGE